MYMLRVLQFGVTFVVALSALYLIKILFPSFEYQVSAWLKSEVAATWFGAVGTVAAFASAIYLARRGDVARRQEPLMSLSAIIFRAEYFCRVMPVAVHVEGMQAIHFLNTASSRKIDGVIKALDRFPVDRLVDFSAIEALFDTQDAMILMKELVDRTDLMNESWISTFSASIFIRAEIRSKMELAIAHLEAVRAGAGID